MKLITNKSKNLLYRIVNEVNTTVQFSTSYAIATQQTADTKALVFTIQGRSTTDIVGLTTVNEVSLGKLTTTFTTPSSTGYYYIRFGLDGSQRNTMCNCAIDLKPSTTYTFTCNFTNITQGSISWKDMMLVEGSTAGEYEPYSYNLLDKWHYVATQTINGVTFTNNGDGTITYNGVTSVGANYSLQSGLSVVSGHKYLSYVGENTNDKISVLLYADKDPYDTFDNRFPNAEGGISTALKNSNELYYQPKPLSNISFFGFILKPQLYDLTLMYGAGKEPTTVDQFYTDHPELKVSPLGFIGLKNLEISNKNIKRLRYATTTRNLFDINRFGGITSSISIDGNMLLTIIPSDDHGDTFVFKCTISVKKNTNYIISVQDHSYDIVSCYVYTDKLWGNRLSFGSFPLKFNSGDNGSLVIGFYSIGSRRQPNVATWIQGPQIEEGSTATPYVPYGYLDLGIIPSNSGIH